MENKNPLTEEITAVFVTPEEQLAQWQGHRRVTRRAIEAFPEDKLFTYSVGGMRPFGELVQEILTLGVPGIRGVVSRKWKTYQEAANEFNHAKTKAELLKLWDQSTEEITALWPQISQQRFQEMDTFFGQYPGSIYSSILYTIDNEIHHRAQGYVYLRALGIEPPAFWNRD